MDIGKGWIGVDLDGTLAHYEGWSETIGHPIPLMLSRVKKWLKDGIYIKIMTARADKPEQISIVEEWCQKHIGQILEVTNIKDLDMIELWDDRCIQIIPNTGLRADGYN